MNISKKIFLFIISTILFFSCADESPWDTGKSSGKGKLKLYLSTDTEVASKVPQVRSVSADITPPPTEEFQIRLTSSDGVYAKTWASVYEFEKEESFPAGTYNIEAFYGTPSAQGIVTEGDKGYEYSYYYAKNEGINIEAGETTNIQLHTNIANSIVIVEYAEAFKNYFKDWTTTLYPKGQLSLELGNSEGKCYVTPGDIEIIIKATLQDGRSVKMTPGEFECLPQHLYKIRYNVYNGEVGEMDKIEIVFNDSPDETDHILIDLTDDLLSGEGPTITTDGFQSGDKIEVLESNPYADDVKFTVNAKDGISEAILTVKSDSYLPDFLKDGWIDLCKIDENVKQLMEKDGFSMIGFQDPASIMALLDLKKLISNLPGGKHEISLLVKDKATKTSENISLEVSTIPLDCNILSSKCYFGDDFAELTVTFNGSDPTEAGNNLLSFYLADELTELPVISINDIPYDTRGFESHTYTYKLKLPQDRSLDIYPINLHFNHSETPKSHKDVEVIYPDYDVEFDAFAKRLLLRVTNIRFGEQSAQELESLVIDRLRILSETSGEIYNTRTFDTDSKIMTISGMEPGKDLGEVKTTLRYNPTEENHYIGKEKIIMEEVLPVPNGDFEEIGGQIDTGIINLGGQYAVSINPLNRYNPKYQNLSSIYRNEPAKWGCYNSLTCYKDTENRNTWYMAPSCYIENNIATILVVGYNHNGPTPEFSGGYMNTNYYCENSPNLSDFKIKVGELFLGSYLYDGFGETKEEGICFSSRPDKFSFNYSYMSLNDEKAKLIFDLKDINDNILQHFEKILDPTSEWEFDDSKLANPSSFINIDINNYEYGVKAVKLEIKFISSISENPEIFIPSGNALKEKEGQIINITSEESRTVDPNRYKTKAIGSVLKISDLEFIYK